MQIGYAPVGGARLSYETSGDGEPLLLIHAGVADGRMWAAQLSPFAARYRVITYDMRGFGRTEVTGGPFAPHEDAAALLRFLGVERAAVVAGELTDEDVPPKSSGGRPLVLTCKPCNNTAGSKLDASAHRKETVLGILRGEPSEERRVRATIEGVTVEAGIAVENGVTLLRVREGFEREGTVLAEHVSRVRRSR